jgi:hypothetical protein
MPAMFGLAAASHILCQLADMPFHPEPIFKLTEGQYETQLQRLTEREDLVYGNGEGPAVDLDDVSISPSCIAPVQYRIAGERIQEAYMREECLSELVVNA